MADRFYKDIEVPDLPPEVTLDPPEPGFIGVYGRNGQLAYINAAGLEVLLGAAAGGGAAAGVPTVVAAGENYTVPEEQQAVFMKRIRLEDGARIKAFGILVEPR